MYKEILLPIDNSRYSDFGIDMGVALAKIPVPSHRQSCICCKAA